MKGIHALSVIIGVLTGVIVLFTNFSVGLLLVCSLLISAALTYISKYENMSQKDFFTHEVRALGRSFWFHPENDDLEKFVAVALIITWCIITVGVAFGFAHATTEYTIITAIVWMFIGRLWGQEASKEVTHMK